MLNNLLKEYTAIRVTYELAGKDHKQETHKVLHKIEDYLSQNEWKCDPDKIENKTFAIFAFFDMFANKIGGDIPAMMCYYFSTLVSKDLGLPLKSRLIGNEYRAFITFKNMDKWNRIIMLARLAPMAGYKGHLDDTSFLDILLLGDVYKAWDVDSKSVMLSNLKRQAPNIAKGHPQFSKQQVIVESELAHESIFEIIKSIVTF